MIGIEIAKKIADELELSKELAREIRDYYAKLDVVMGWASGGSLEPQFDRVRSNLLEVSGDITAHGADINANTFNENHDSRFNLHENSALKGAFWWDVSFGNVVLQNVASGKPIVFNTEGGSWHYYNDQTDKIVAFVTPTGGYQTMAIDSDPDYSDGYAIIYLYSDGGGTDELRARAKIGATETQVTLADLSP